MAEAPWLTIIGLGEDGSTGLSPASGAALAAAEVVIGPPRHLSLIPAAATQERIEWPAPFAEGLPILLGLRGRRAVLLASGDPFWFGAGAVVARALEPGDWRCLPGPSTFSLAASRLGWPLERTTTLGLHAAPVSRLRPHLRQGARIIALLRDGPAVAELTRYLRECGFGASVLTVLEALGGPRERISRLRAEAAPERAYAHPVAAAVEVAGDGPSLPCVPGLDDALFETDGQITKSPMRALTLAALAPRPGERLWDIGGGSGSVAIEWLLAHPETEAASIEPRADRAERIRANARRLGADRLTVVEGAAPAALDGMPAPDAVFVGGGLCEGLLADLARRLPAGVRLVATAVTLESEALLAAWQARRGGALLRVALSEAAPLGGKRAWKGAYPATQWKVVL